VSVRLRSVLSSLALVLLAGTSWADVVHLRGGRRIVGTVEESGETVRIRFEGGTLTIPKSQVESIERGELPREAFDRRLAATAEDDVAGALDLAAFAEGAGLTEEAGRVLGRAAVRLPRDTRLREALRRWSVFVRKLPSDPEADAQLAAAVAGTTNVAGHLHLTDHFRIAHDVDLDRARRAGEALESAYVKVYEIGARLGIDTRALDRRMDVLLFADHARWVRATGRPAEELAGLSGLYVHAERRVYLFDTATLPAACASRAALDAAREKLAAFESSIDAARADLVRAEAEAAENLRGAAADSRGTGGDDAASAADAGGRSAAAALADVRLADVVTDARFADPAGDHGRAYAEAWSLAWHLTRKRPAQFARLLREGRLVAVNDPRAAALRLVDFRACFGDDLGAVEAEWKADVVRLLR